MEVKLELVASTEKLLPELNKTKSATKELSTAAEQCGNSYSVAFRKAADTTTLLQKNAVNAASSTRAVQAQVVDFAKVVTKYNSEIEKGGKKQKADIQQTDSAYKSLKTRIREAKEEVDKLTQLYGKQSEQVRQAAIEYGKLKDEQKKLNELADAFHPDQKAAVYGQLIRGVAGGFEAAIAATAIFGDKSETVEKALVRIQAAMLFTQGLNELLELDDALKNIALTLGIVKKAKTQEAASTIQQAEAESVATTGSISHNVAMEAEVVTTEAATVATETFGAALKSALLPIGIMVAAVAALVYIYKELTDTSEELESSIKAATRANELFNESSQRQQALSQDRQDYLQSELDLLKAKGATEEDIAKKRQELMNQQLVDFQNEVNQNVEQVNKLIQLQTLLEKRLKEDPSAENLKAVFQNEDAIQSLRDRNKHILNEAKILGNKYKQEDAETQKALLDKQKQYHSDYLQAEKNFQDALKQLRDKVLSGEAELATGEERLRIQKQQGENEIEQLRKTLIEKGQEEENALAKEHGRKAREFKLTQEQETQLHQLEILLQRKFNKDLEDLQLQKSQTLIELVRDGNQKQLEAFDISFKQLAAKLKAAGTTEQQIEEERIRRRKLLEAQLFEGTLDIEQQTQEATINARKQGAEREVEFETKKQIDILNVQLEFAKKRLAIEETLYAFDPTPERQKAIAGLDALITDIERQIKSAQIKLKTVSGEFSFAKLFGLKGLTADEEKQFNDAANSIISSVSQIYQSIVAEQQAANEQAIQQNQDYIQSLEDRIQATQSALDKETEAQRKGYANNVDAKKKELAQLQAEKQKAIEDEKRLQKEREKLAREQAIIDSITQTSQLLSAGATLFAKGAFSGVVGVVTAIATIASMIAAFLALKSKVSQATKLAEGGIIGGRSHAQGGNKYISLDGNDILEHEAGEFVVKKSVTKKRARLLNAINREDFSTLTFQDIEPLLKGTGMRLRAGVERGIAGEANSVSHAFALQAQNGRSAGANKTIDELHDEVRGIRKIMESHQVIETNADGSKIIRKKQGNVEHVTIIRPNNG